MVRANKLSIYFNMHVGLTVSEKSFLVEFVMFSSIAEKKSARRFLVFIGNNILIILFCRGMISRSKVQMFSYDQLFQAYQKDKFVLVSYYRWYSTETSK